MVVWKNEKWQACWGGTHVNEYYPPTYFELPTVAKEITEVLQAVGPDVWQGTVRSAGLGQRVGGATGAAGKHHTRYDSAEKSLLFFIK